MEIFKVENLSFTYPLCKEKALDNISFGIKRGDFVTVCGATGSGKSTLLRMLKRELSPLGEKKGSIYFCGKETERLDEKTAAGEVGFVMQKPEQQIVTDKVWHELAFGLENMNIPQKTIYSRIAETAAYFGIENLFDKKTSELSGGQKQLLNLAAVMVMRPKALILDEPTAQLDPIAASDFIASLKKLSRELGLTVIIAEHRLEEVIPISDKLMIIEGGRLNDYDTPDEVIKRMSGNERLLSAMPASARLYHKLSGEGKCPLDIREGRDFIEANFKNGMRELAPKKYSHSENPALEFNDVYFRYERQAPDILKGLSLTVYEGEIFCILGGNGSGKTTALCAASDLIKPYSGKIKIFGRDIKKYKNQSLYNECLTMLPQDVQTVFLRNTVREELESCEEAVKLLPVDIGHLYEKHPYDLSGGEQQLVALAKALAAKPRLLLMDEPTKGLDANAKNGLAEIVKKLKNKGMTIVIVTHDAEFTALCADRCALFFGGCIASCGAPEELFSENNFYTTAASRMTRDYYSGAVTVDEVAELCIKNGRKRENI